MPFTVLLLEENVVHIVDTAHTTLFREFTEFVLVHENFLVLLATNELAKDMSSSGVSNIGHVSFDFVLQLAPTLAEDMHLQYPPVVTEAITGPYSRIFVQGPLEERLEIFGVGVLELGLGGFMDIRAKAVHRVVRVRSCMVELTGSA